LKDRPWRARRRAEQSPRGDRRKTTGSNERGQAKKRHAVATRVSVVWVDDYGGTEHADAGRSGQQARAEQ